MKLDNFQKLVGDSLDLLYGIENKELTFSIPFEEYHELVIDCMNSTLLTGSSFDKSFAIKHFYIHGVQVHLIAGEKLEMRVGGMKEGETFFESIKFEPLPHQKNP